MDENERGISPKIDDGIDTPNLDLTAGTRQLADRFQNNHGTIRRSQAAISMPVGTMRNQEKMRLPAGSTATPGQNDLDGWKGAGRRC